MSAPNMESAKGIARREAQDDATDMNIWKIPMGGQPMLWMHGLLRGPDEEALREPR